MNKQAEKDANVERILIERQRLESELSKMSPVLKVFPSDANFLMLKVKDADKLYEHIKQHGTLVRNVSHYLNCENCLRITIGTFDENNKVLSLIKNFQ